MSDGYTIRRARPADLPLLPALERAAALRFLGTPYAYLVGDDPVTAEVDLGREHVWVAEAPNGARVGFVIAHASGRTVHLHELDVLPEHAGRGLGRRLIETVAVWARGQGAAALTLTTFANVAWNGPYYARLGFRRLGPDALSPELREELAAEHTWHPAGSRIAMQLDL